jgi:hypothetical protein
MLFLFANTFEGFAILLYIQKFTCVSVPFSPLFGFWIVSLASLLHGSMTTVITAFAILSHFFSFLVPKIPSSVNGHPEGTPAGQKT